MSNKIYGIVRDSASGGAPVKGLRIRAWDEDWPDGDDFMGEDTSNKDGSFEIRYRAGHWDPVTGGGRPTWRPDIYLTVDVKNAKGQWVHICKSRVHKDYNLNLDLRIDLEVRLDASVSKRTNFIPEEHGFHFDNIFIVEPEFLGVDVGTYRMGFCGGMCSGALHRYRKGIPIPTDSIAPEDGTTLHEELGKRQIKAMSPEMLPKMFDWQSSPDVAAPMRKTSIAKRTVDEWPKLQRALDNGQPAILVLIRARGYFGNPTNNHQVLAIGYDFNPATKDLTVYTYDPNQHDKTNTLKLNIGLPSGGLQLKDSRSTRTRGFFVNPVGEAATRLPIGLIQG